MEYQDTLAQLFHSANVSRWSAQTESKLRAFQGELQNFDRKHLEKELLKGLSKKSSSREELIISLILLSQLGLDRNRLADLLVKHFQHKLHIQDLNYIAQKIFEDEIPLHHDLIYDITARIVFDIKNSYERIVDGFKRVPRKRGKDAVLFLALELCRADLNAQNRDLLYIVLSKIQLPLPNSLAELANSKLEDIRKKLKIESLKNLDQIYLPEERVEEHDNSTAHAKNIFQSPEHSPNRESLSGDMLGVNSRTSADRNDNEERSNADRSSLRAPGKNASHKHGGADVDAVAADTAEEADQHTPKPKAGNHPERSQDYSGLLSKQSDTENTAATDEISLPWEKDQAANSDAAARNSLSGTERNEHSDDAPRSPDFSSDSASKSVESPKWIDRKMPEKVADGIGLETIDDLFVPPQDTDETMESQATEEAKLSKDPKYADEKARASYNAAVPKSRKPIGNATQKLASFWEKRPSFSKRLLGILFGLLAVCLAFILVITVSRRSEGTLQPGDQAEETSELPPTDMPQHEPNPEPATSPDPITSLQELEFPVPSFADARTWESFSVEQFGDEFLIRIDEFDRVWDLYVTLYYGKGNVPTQLQKYAGWQWRDFIEQVELVNPEHIDLGMLIPGDTYRIR